MAQNEAQLLSLPIEIIDEILKRMDIQSINNISRTCKFFKDKVHTFRLTHPEVMRLKIAEQRAYVDYGSDNDNDDYRLSREAGWSDSEYEPADDIEALIEEFQANDFDCEWNDFEEDDDDY